MILTVTISDHGRETHIGNNRGFGITHGSANLIRADKDTLHVIISTLKPYHQAAAVAEFNGNRLWLKWLVDEQAGDVRTSHLTSR